MRPLIQPSSTRKPFVPASSTPAPTSGSGSFTSVSSALHITKVGALRFFDCTVSITTNGTAAGYVSVALPETAATSTGGGGYNAGTANVLAWQVTGAELRIYKADGTYPGGSGSVLQASGHYRV